MLQSDQDLDCWPSGYKKAVLESRSDVSVPLQEQHGAGSVNESVVCQNWNYSNH